MLFPTPRYRVEVNNALIALAGGPVMLAPSGADSLVSEVVARRSMRSVEIPSIEDLLGSQPKPYPIAKTSEANNNEPLVCLHTSGTTGFLKPIIWTHDWADIIAKGHHVSAPTGYELADGDSFVSQKRIMNLFPRMHASDVITSTISPFCLGATVVHPSFRAMPNEAVDAAVEAIEGFSDEDRIEGLALPPPHAEYLATNHAMIERLRKKLPMVLWSGRSVPDATGTSLSAKFRVHFLASTEMAIGATIWRSDSDNTKTVRNEFQYFTFQTALNISFDAVSDGEEGVLYEAKITKNQGKNAWVQPIFKTYTEMSEMSLGDMFVRHPHHADKWKYAGHADDMLTFLSGESFYPSAAEREITVHPGVMEAAIVSARRPTASLVLRLNNGVDIEDVWGVVEKVNQKAPVYA